MIEKWTRSIINHVYWCALSSEKDNADVIAEKWLSVGNHIHNKHKKRGKYYKNCKHGRIRRKWFKHSTVELTLFTLLLILL